MIKVTYRGKELLCVYVRHTLEKISVRTTRETVNHLWNNGPQCLNGPFTDVVVWFPLNQVQVIND
jgi:protein-tyrosine phosphatase